MSPPPVNRVPAGAVIVDLTGDSSDDDDDEEDAVNPKDDKKERTLATSPARAAPSNPVAEPIPTIENEDDDDDDDWEDILILGSDGIYKPVGSHSEQPTIRRGRSATARRSPGSRVSRVPAHPTIYQPAPPNPWHSESRNNIIQLFLSLDDHANAIRVASKAASDPHIIGGVFQMVFFPDGSHEQIGNNTKPSEA